MSQRTAPHTSCATNRVDAVRRHGLGAGIALAATAWAGTPRAAAPQRIVSVGGALTETLFALGAQAELVGVDSTSFYPEAARKLPSVGYARALSAEGVLSLTPSLLVASDEAGPPSVLRQIEAARVPVQLLPSDHRFEGVIERSSALARLVGREPAGAELVERLRAEWRTAMQRVAALRGAAPPKVLFVLAHAQGQVRVAGRDTSAQAMMAYAGGSNVFAGEGGFAGYRPLTPEAVIAAAPEVLLTTDQGLAAVGGVAGLLKLPGLAQTPAGRAQRVLSFDALWLLGFGPRLPQAVTALAEAMHLPRRSTS